ncbi:MAG: DeoR/GlpR family DNA-binding transcription regulator [Streptosporangiales bacterium]
MVSLSVCSYRRRLGGMLAARRRQLILDAVRNGAGVEVAQLAQRFSVSAMTVRRDLAQMADEGKLSRVRGGALSDRHEPPFADIVVERLEAKECIGATAAGMVADGQTVMVDIGTTTLQLARHLHGRDITVVTSSLAVLEELLPDPQVELVVLGGAVRRNYRSLVGVLAEGALGQLSADVAFLGASGVDTAAVLDTTMVEVAIKRGMIAAARRIGLLVDAQKFSMHGAVRVCPLGALDVVVTDAGADEPGIAALVECGVQVVHTNDRAR